MDFKWPTKDNLNQTIPKSLQITYSVPATLKVALINETYVYLMFAFTTYINLLAIDETSNTWDDNQILI